MVKVSKVLSDKELSNKYYNSGLASKISVLPEESLWLPSRNLYLNYTMGGGIPYGKICEIFGGESSGKSLVAMDFGYSAQYLGGIVLWNDAEQSFDPHWAIANGLQLDKTHIFNETSIELVSDWAADMTTTMRSRLKNNEPILLVHDSIAAFDCEANINSIQTDAKAEMGNRAKALYKYLRIRNQHFSELGIIVIFINQLRKRVGVTRFEDPDTTPGGEAMKFYAHQRLAFFRKKQIAPGTKTNKIWIGNEVSVRLKKNKVAPPKPSFITEIYFSEEHGKVGFDRYSNLAELFERTGVILRKKGSSHYYFRNKVIANGRDNFQEMLESDPDLRRKLLRKSKINTISNVQKRLDDLKDREINRYPITIVKKKSQVSDDE